MAEETALPVRLPPSSPALGKGEAAYFLTSHIDSDLPGNDTMTINCYTQWRSAFTPTPPLYLYLLVITTAPELHAFFLKY